MRENPSAYAAATKLYQQLTDAGVHERNRIREVANLLGGEYSVQRVGSWIRRYKSEGSDTEE